MTTSPLRHVGGVITLALAMIGSFAALGSYFDRLSGAASYDVSAWRGSAGHPAPVSAMAGQGIFLAPRFACAACHKIGQDGVGIRGPNLGVMTPQFTTPIAVRAATEQRGKTAVQHLVQALYEPDAYVVHGFDAHVMPPVNKPPLMLTHEDIRSVILFMFQRSGVPPTAALTAEILEAQRPYMDDVPDAGTAAPARVERPVTPGDAQAGDAHFAALGCATCHHTGGDAAAPGALARTASPSDLFLLLANHPSLDGGAVSTGALTVAQLEDLVTYLRSPVAPPDGGVQ